MICVECATEIQSLYAVKGGQIEATKCENCKNFADKYLESEGILVGIDLLLLRPSAIRHLVYNSDFSKPYKVPFFTPFMCKLILLSLMCDVYFEWVVCEDRQFTDEMASIFINKFPKITQYILLFILCVLNTLLLHGGVGLVAKISKKVGFASSFVTQSRVSRALLIASFTRLLPLLTHIWKYEQQSTVNIVLYARLVFIMDILRVTLNTSVWLAFIITATSFILSIYLHKYFWVCINQLYPIFVV